MKQKEPRNPVSIFKWIWQAFLSTAIIPLVVVELVFIGIYFFTSNWSQTEMVNLLRKEVQTELQNHVDKESEIIQQQLLSISNATELYRLQTKKAIMTPAAISPEDKERLAYSPEGVYYTVKDREDGGAAIFYSGIVPKGEAERGKVDRVFTSQKLMKDIIESQPLATSVYLNTFDSLNIIYPYFDVITQYMPLMDIPTYNFYYEADSAHNPERKVKWTDAYLDPAGHGWMASAIAPIYDGDFLEGVVGIDVTIDTITNQILNLNIPWNGYGVLVSKDGTILALPEKGERDWGLSELTDHHYSEAVLEDTYKPEQFNMYKRVDFAFWVKQVEENNNGFAGITLNGIQQVVSWATVPETGWKLLVVVPEKNIYAKVDQMSQKLFKIGRWMIGGLVVFYIGFFGILSTRARKMSTKLSQPLVEINNLVQKIGSGDYYQKNPEYFVNELQETATLLVNMGRQLGTTNASLLVTQSKLKKRESDLQALMDSIDDVIFEVDENGVFINIWTNNPDVLAKPYNEIIGSSFESIMDIESASLYKSLIKRVIETKQPETVEYELETPRGLRWFQARISRIANDSKTVSLSARDITERKEMEKSIIVAKEEAEKASRAKSQFLSNMSHELRTPLNAILGFTQLLEIDPSAPLNESQDQSVKEILKAGNHLVVLINDVLDLAKIESGKTTLSVEPVQIDLIMEETHNLIVTLADKNNINIITRTEVCTDQFVIADRTRLKQVLLNLLSNAIKYNRENGEVRFNCEAQNNIIRINVFDNGYGIPSEDIEAIFDPFYRVSGTSNLVEGTGIGLTVAKQLIELMGGSIGVESEEGIGSHFWIELKIGISSHPEKIAKLYSNDESDEVICNEFKILYVEDNSANLALMERILTHCPNVKLFSAATGELGIDLAIVHRPNLVLLDINLPGIDGFEVLKRLREYEETKNVTVIAISASVMAKDVERGLSAGFAEYITKPIDVTNFIKTISHYRRDFTSESGYEG